MTEHYPVDEDGRAIPNDRDALGRQVKKMEPRYLAPNERDPSEMGRFVDAPWLLDTWRATRDCSFEIHVDGPRPVGHRGPATIYGPPAKRKYVLKAGEIAKIPRIYRDAVQTVKNGMVQGGLCPHMVLLTQAGEPVPVPLHPSIDPSIAPKVAPDLAPDPGRAARLLARAAKGAA